MKGGGGGEGTLKQERRVGGGVGFKTVLPPWEGGGAGAEY